MELGRELLTFTPCRYLVGLSVHPAWHWVQSESMLVDQSGTST
jgi:hypothetical protein